MGLENREEIDLIRIEKWGEELGEIKKWIILIGGLKVR